MWVEVAVAGRVPLHHQVRIPRTKGLLEGRDRPSGLASDVTRSCAGRAAVRPGARPVVCGGLPFVPAGGTPPPDLAFRSSANRVRVEIVVAGGMPFRQQMRVAHGEGAFGSDRLLVALDGGGDRASFSAGRASSTGAGSLVGRHLPFVAAGTAPPKTAVGVLSDRERIQVAVAGQVQLAREVGARCGKRAPPSDCGVAFGSTAFGFLSVGLLSLARRELFEHRLPLASAGRWSGGGGCPQQLERLAVLVKAPFMSLPQVRAADPFEPPATEVALHTVVVAGHFADSPVEGGAIRQLPRSRRLNRLLRSSREPSRTHAAGFPAPTPGMSGFRRSR